MKHLLAWGRNRIRFIATLVLFCVYSVVFVIIFPLTGDVVAALVLIPIGVSGWLFGRRGGVRGFIVSVALNTVLVGYSRGTWTGIFRQFPGVVLSGFVGYGVGWVSELVATVRENSIHLRQDRERLQAEIEQRKIIEADLAAARDAAEAANRAKSTFLATMSHELRTPLNAILGYSEMLREQAELENRPDDIADLARIHESGSHLLSLISDILDLSKIEAGKIELHFEMVSVDQLVSELATMLAPHLATNNNNFHVQRIGTLGVVRTDVTRLRQILLNILQNAAKFTNRGEITFTVERDDDENRLCFQVEDTGIGMHPEQLGRLFQPFMQADSSTTRRFGGTGLGLTIARHLCRLLGGEITVHSIIDQGTTFTIEIPIEQRPLMSPRF